jgi:hypothetical protein
LSRAIRVDEFEKDGLNATVFSWEVAWRMHHQVPAVE